jgi:4-hydroxybenzoate polyprenyltransferase
METQTTIAGIIFNIIQWILGAIGILGVVGLLPLVGVGIYFFVKSSNEADPEKKALLKKKGNKFAVAPFIMIFGALILLVVFRAVRSLLGIE